MPTEREIRDAEPEQLRAMVAEALGWVLDDDWGCPVPPDHVKPGEVWLPSADGSQTLNVNAVVFGLRYNADLTKIYLPNWPTDIREAWELHKSARQRLGPARYAFYLFELGDIMAGKFPGRASCWMALLEFFDADTICRAWLLARER